MRTTAAEVRPGVPVAREAVRRHQRLGQAQQLVDVHRHRREPAQPRRHAARQRPVPRLLRGGHPGRRQVPRAAARVGVRGGQRPPPRRQRGAAGHHLRSSSATSSRTSSTSWRRAAAKTTKQGGFMEIGVGVLPQAAARRRRPQPHQPVRLHRQQVRVPRRRRLAVDRRPQHRAQHHRGRVARLHRHQPGEGRRRPARTCNKAIQDLLPGIIKESKKVALQRRQLHARNGTRKPRSAACPTCATRWIALPVIIRKDTIELFTKYKVYSERELQSRLDDPCARTTSRR